MASVTFDKLWEEAFEREGELFISVRQLAIAYSISSGVESVRLAKVFHEAGQPFYTYCDITYKVRKRMIDERLKRKHNLSEHGLALFKKLMQKLMKGE